MLPRWEEPCMKQDRHKSQYRITFRQRLDIDNVADSLTLAICGAEGLHGRARVRLDGSWWFDRQRRVCRIDGSTQVGRDIARLFIGYLVEEFGEGTFTVRRPEPVAVVQEPR